MSKDIEEKIRQAVNEARTMAHPDHVGLTDQDRKEIKAYHTGVINLATVLQKKLLD